MPALGIVEALEIVEGCVNQDVGELQTKFANTFTTKSFPIGDEVRSIVDDWVNLLKTEKLWGHDDPLFPASRVTPGDDRQFEAAGLDRKYWSNAAPIRRIF